MGCISVAPLPAVPPEVGGSRLISTSQADKLRLSKARPPELLGKGKRTSSVLLGRKAPCHQVRAHSFRLLHLRFQMVSRVAPPLGAGCQAGHLLLEPAAPPAASAFSLNAWLLSGCSHGDVPRKRSVRPLLQPKFCFCGSCLVCTNGSADARLPSFVEDVGCAGRREGTGQPPLAPVQGLAASAP